MTDFRIALTFDAEHPSRSQCPPGVCEGILETLSSAGVSATFFLQGRWASAYPALARAIADRGHLVGSHSHSHVPMPDLSETGLASDIEKAETVIRQVTGVDPRPWFRCPFGLGRDDAHVLAALQAHGYRHVDWNVSGSDWEDERTSADVYRQITERSLLHGDGAIVLLHTWPAPTAAALPDIIERLCAENARFVSVAELDRGA